MISYLSNVILQLLLIWSGQPVYKCYRFILYARFLYSYTLITYYNSIPQDILEDPVDPVTDVLEEISSCVTAVHSICEAKEVSKELEEIRNHRYHLYTHNNFSPFFWIKICCCQKNITQRETNMDYFVHLALTSPKQLHEN